MSTPTNGFPTQSQAIVAKFKAGATAKQIADEMSISINSIYRAVKGVKRRKSQVDASKADRRAGGIPPQTDRIWSLGDNDRRAAFHVKMVLGAKKAREATHGQTS